MAPTSGVGQESAYRKSGNVTVTLTVGTARTNTVVYYIYIEMPSLMVAYLLRSLCLDITEFYM